MFAILQSKSHIQAQGQGGRRQLEGLDTRNCEPMKALLVQLAHLIKKQMTLLIFICLDHS